jgi:peptidoglycan LD-endopeptidase CwlK
MREDKITLQRIQTLHPIIRDEVHDIYVHQIVPALTGDAICRFAYTTRTFQEQADLYAQGRTRLFDNKGRRLGIVTNAKAGMSWHNYGLALDIVLLVDRDGNGSFESASWDTRTDFDKDGVADWEEVVRILKGAGYVWGGDWTRFPDRPHFEKTFGMTTKQAMAKWISKDFIPGTNYIKI